MKNSRWLYVATAIAMAAMVAPVQAQEAGSTPTPEEPTTPTPRPFDELDTNADRTLSKDEAAVDPALAQMFGTLDKDADGLLTPEEYAAYTPRTP